MSAPVTGKEALERAQRWVCARTGCTGWSSIGILLPGPVSSQPRHLRLARTRGVSVGCAQDLAELHRWTGPLIVAQPTPASLVAAETTKATAIVAVAQDAAALGPWVDAFHPDHLGGTALAPAEVVLPVPPVRRAMVYYTHRLHSGAPPTGRLWQMLLHRLEYLHRHEGHFPAESLLALAWQLHWPPETAGELYQWADQHLPPEGPLLPAH